MSRRKFGKKNVKKKRAGVLGLSVMLAVVLIGSVLFVGAVSGWFEGSKVVLDAEYQCDDECGMMELDVDGYEELVKEKKSFAVFIDQGGCKTAERLREYVQKWSIANGVRVYRMMFEDVKETTLHDFVKYYPSVAIISRGKVKGYLRADSDADASAYNDYAEFERWISNYL